MKDSRKDSRNMNYGFSVWKMITGVTGVNKHFCTDRVPTQAISRIWLPSPRLKILCSRVLQEASTFKNTIIQSFSQNKWQIYKLTAPHKVIHSI